MCSLAEDLTLALALALTVTVTVTLTLTLTLTLILTLTGRHQLHASDAPYCSHLPRDFIISRIIITQDTTCT